MRKKIYAKFKSIETFNLGPCIVFHVSYDKDFEREKCPFIEKFVLVDDKPYKVIGIECFSYRIIEAGYVFGLVCKLTNKKPL